MSRTDVHRPWHVQVVDPHNRHLLYRYPAWPWRQERAAWRTVRQRLLAVTDREDVDVPPLRGSAL